MKTIILIRHAKSSWKFHDLKDIERPLKKRGQKDAARMAHVLREMKIHIDKFISSPAERALSTAIAFALRDEIAVDQRLYLESKSKLLSVIQELDENFQSVVLFSHNPDLTDFANFLANDTIENIPTAGMVGIQFDVNSWKEIEKGKGKRLFFEIPKKYRKEKEKAEAKTH